MCRGSTLPERTQGRRRRSWPDFCGRLWGPQGWSVERWRCSNWAGRLTRRPKCRRPARGTCAWWGRSSWWRSWPKRSSQQQEGRSPFGWWWPCQAIPPKESNWRREWWHWPLPYAQAELPQRALGVLATSRKRGLRDWWRSHSSMSETIDFVHRRSRGQRSKTHCQEGVPPAQGQGEERGRPCGYPRERQYNSQRKTFLLRFKRSEKVRGEINVQRTFRRG